MGKPIRVLVVDDYAPFRDFVRLTLQKRPGLQVIGEVADGMAAVQQTEELRPDLVLLDIGLPTLHGIEAARRIRELSPTSKILFVSENRFRHVAEEALCSGGDGYVVKSDAGIELLPAVESVLQGRQFVSAGVEGRGSTEAGAPTPVPGMAIAGRHEAGFYSDDRWLLEEVTKFIGSALHAGNAAIVAATEPHRDSLVSSLRACGLDIGAAIEQGRYIALDAAQVLSAFMLHGMPDPVRFMKAFSDLIAAAAAATQAQHPRVAIFGECVQLLWAQGNAEATIQMEKLGNQLVRQYDVDILCGYSLHGFHDMMDGRVYQQICAEHSAVHSW